MKKNAVLNVLKWTWLLVVLAVASWYFITNFAELKGYLAEIKVAKLALSFLLILIGKSLSAHLTYLSLKMVSHPIRPQEAFSIASVTQLGKYLPGGIWHFAGKLGIYKARGISVKNATKPVILENIWLFASAFAAGSFALFTSKSDLLCTILGVLCGNFNQIWIAAPLLLIWVLLMFLVNKRFAQSPFSMLLHLSFSIEQLLLWILFGISFWLLFPSQADFDFLLLSTAAFSVSWLAGYAAVFAPGGIGIREAVLALLLAEYLPSETIAIHASIHRLLWIAAELIIAAFSATLFGIPLGMKKDDKEEDPAL